MAARPRDRARLAAMAIVVAVAAPARPDGPDAPAPGAEERASLHYQATVATQAHPGFPAAYSGPNSLRAGGESATSVVMDLFAGVRPWRGGEIWFQPELAGGRGLSGTLGVAAFPSGEVYRVGDPTPTLVVGRVFLRQTIALGGGAVRVEGEQLQLAGARARHALTLTAGKLATTDVVDRVPFSSDPHTQLMSWGLWASAAYDYPADTRGYTFGIAADVALGPWSARAGLFLEPTAANAMTLQWDVTRARGLVAEVERRHALRGRAGALRALAFLNTARMGTYGGALAASAASPDVVATRAEGRTKAGLAASANQDLGGGLGAFLRASWNDGRNESWAFTEIDRSIAAGLVQSGARWRRPRDEAGLGVVVSGLSSPHRRYLAAGGRGFLLGDRALRYGPEVLGELSYRAALTREASAGVGWQPILNPGFNRDRGPAHVFTGRVHVEF